MAAQRYAGATRHGGEGDRQERRRCDRTDDERDPSDGGILGQGGADDERNEGEGREQRAAEIVEHLPARHAVERAVSRRTPENPRKQLPVAARPAMLAIGRDIVAGGKLLDELDIGSEPGAREGAFEEIVAEQRVLGDTSLERALEGVDVVDALAGVGAFAEEILVDVGDGRRIGIDAAGAGEDALIERSVPPGRERRGDAWLQDGIAVDDTPSRRRRSAAGSAGAPSCRSAGARHPAAAACRRRA